MEVTVVGAGVIGLTTALTLEERGHRVRIVAAARRADTTSAIAGAVWFPYRVGPPNKVTVWAMRTRKWLEQLAGTPEAGIDVLTGYEILGDDGTTRPWWAAAPTMEGDGLIESIDVEWVPSPVVGAPAGWKFTAPRAQPSLFLPFLESLIEGEIEQRIVTNIHDEPGDVVINCTGLGARDLVGDDKLYGLLGQIVIAERGSADLATTVTDDRDPERIFYIIPRRDELVLGGCSLPFPPGDTPQLDPDITARILAHAKRLGISVGAVRTERVGLRPYRAEVRLERDPHHKRVIHNYGHGGAGFTLCRGCAEDVATLLG
ncbi:MAG TPA: FAD-dependent oxidoreductase [Kofleriaceae bacterium]|nr:FAD-dependent oxidoreductase [Kofleriaceae bacterium]